MIFHFSGDYESGEVKECEEGEFVWLTAQEVKRQQLFPSVREVIDHILNPSDGTVFMTCEYSKDKKKIVRAKKDFLSV